jgi:hypothetical protein
MGGGYLSTSKASSVTNSLSPTSNPQSHTNPWSYDPNPLTDEELNSVYDYTFNQLQPEVKESPLVEESRLTQEVSSSAEGYKTDPDEEMAWYYEGLKLDDELFRHNDGYETDPAEEYITDPEDELAWYYEGLKLDDESLFHHNEGYETDTGEEYATYFDDEMVCYSQDDEYLHRNDGDSDCSSFDSLFPHY